MSHIYESSNSIGYSRLLAWSRSFFASPSASRSLWIPSLCDAILKLFFLFWWKNDVRLFFIYRAEFRGSNQYFVVGWAQGLMTSRFDWWRHANFLGWNPWEWICVKRESFFWLKFRSKEKFFSVFWFDQSESSFAEILDQSETASIGEDTNHCAITCYFY